MLYFHIIFFRKFFHVFIISSLCKHALVKIPKKVNSTYEGYSNLLSEFYKYISGSLANSFIQIDFRENKWLDANLLPIIYGYIEYGRNDLNIISRYLNHESSKVHDLMLRNGFASQCFNMKTTPHKKETVVPFKIFSSAQTQQFSIYIDEELMKYFPQMNKDVKKDLSNYIQELFGNAQIHTNCKEVYTCGQHYPRKQKMDFTIVNLGTTIYNNVKKYFINMKKDIPQHSIEWAVAPGNSTKINNPGGLGLSLMHDFIHFNKGKYQIISGHEFWELNEQQIIIKRFDYPFPGTIINIEISQNDKKFYKYEKVGIDIF